MIQAYEGSTAVMAVPKFRKI